MRSPDADNRDSCCERRGRDLDLLFLALVVFLPALLYLPSLGFYSDDWGFLAAMGEHPNGSLWQYVLWMIPAADLRPGHAVYAALTYYAFGTAPLGYHVVNHLVILLGLVALVAVLRRLGLSRSLALASATIFALMPSYSTLRFWFAAHMANLSLLAYLLSLLRRSPAACHEPRADDRLAGAERGAGPLQRPPLRADDAAPAAQPVRVVVAAARPAGAEAARPGRRPPGPAPGRGPGDQPRASWRWRPATRS